MQLFFEKYPFVGENTSYKNAYIYIYFAEVDFILFYFIFCFYVKTQL